MENNGNGKKNEHRLTTVEVTTNSLCEDMTSVKADLKKILTNDLPHIQAELSGIRRVVKVVGSGITLAIATNIIINLIK